MKFGETLKFTNTRNFYHFDSDELYGKTLNIQSVVSIICNGFICGDDTLLKEYKRTSWNDSEISVKYSEGEIDKAAHAQMLEELLLEEIESYIGSHKKIGITLSGGLDSRIVAGLLRKIQIKSNNQFNVIVYNWGEDSSRDVVYAKRIANLFDWKYIKLPLDQRVLRENFYLNCKLGCEFSPIHLHNIYEVGRDESSEIILYGSYGDSIGRGYFSGKHIKNLQGDVYMKDYFYLLNKQAKETYFNKIIEEKKNVPYSIKGISEFENDLYANYVRRLLGGAASAIAVNKPMYQIYTSKKVLDHMLKLTPDCRDDFYYKYILSHLPNDIGSIPYAKDGKNFLNENEKVQDNLSPKSHSYGKLLRNDLKPFIIENLDFKLLYSLNIFAKGSLEELFYYWHKGLEKGNNRLDELVSFLANLCLFIKENNLVISPDLNYENNIFSDFRFKRLIKLNSYVTTRNFKSRKNS